MSKKNLKLNLNKHVVSNLQAKQVTGGGGSVGNIICHYHTIRFKTDACFSADYQCPWSGPNTQ